MDLSYQQLAEIIREKINSNEYVFGLALPSERELAKSFDVSRSLVRSAIEQLCTEGILKKYHGKGTYFMLKDIDFSSKHFKGMSELLKKAGYDPSSKILNTMTRKAGYKFSKIFDVSEDSPCAKSTVWENTISVSLSSVTVRVVLPVVRIRKSTASI